MLVFEKIESFLVKLSCIVAIIGGMGLLFATFITCLSVILKLLRRILDGLFASYFDVIAWKFIAPILGEEELVAYGVGFALYCALPWVMIQKGHISVDILKNIFSKRMNLFLEFMGDVAFALIAYLLLTRQWFLAFRKARRSEESMIVEILQGNFGVFAERLRDSQVSQIINFPLWPTYIVAEFCIFLFFIITVFCVWRSARNLFIGAVSP